MSALKQALLRAPGPVLRTDFLPDSVRGWAVQSDPLAADGIDFSDRTQFLDSRLDAGSTDLHAEFLALTERHLFLHVLRHTGGNQTQAAKLLGINRATLRARLASLGIQVERSTSIAEDEPFT